MVQSVTVSGGGREGERDSFTLQLYFLMRCSFISINSVLSRNILCSCQLRGKLFGGTFFESLDFRVEGILHTSPFGVVAEHTEDIIYSTSF